MASFQVWADAKVSSQDTIILAQVLKQAFDDGGYTVVSPKTSPVYGNHEQTRRIKQFIQEGLQAKGADIAKLLDKLFERNKKAVRLTLRSSIKDGYIIDYTGKYGNYFKKNHGGWDRWYKEHPKAYSSTRVSLPAVDGQNGFILVYKTFERHWLAGQGWIILYRYKNGKLQELSRVTMWVS
ncbi:MAG: hypothetical protein PHU14_02670 [Methylovulum sp.]|nr:hypothetical protein [Methylovulum sp.]